MAEAAAQLRLGYAPPTLHLAHPNPYLEEPLGALPSLLGRGGPMGWPSLSDSSSSSRPHTGRASTTAMAVNSFGAQGTNAHALLSLPAPAEGAEAEGGEGAAMASPSLFPIEPSRHWIAPLYSPLLSRALITSSKAAPGGLKLTLEGSLASPALSYLWDGPRVPAASAPWLTNSCALSAAAAAVRILVMPGEAVHEAGSGSAAGGSLALLHDVLLSPPAPLPSKPGRPGHPTPALHITVSQHGVLQVSVGGQQQVRARVGVSVSAGKSLSSRAAEADAQAAPASAGSPSTGVKAVLASIVRAALLQFTPAAAPPHPTATAALATHHSNQPGTPGLVGEGYPVSLQPQALDAVMQLAVAHAEGVKGEGCVTMATAQVFMAAVAAVKVDLTEAGAGSTAGVCGPQELIAVSLHHPGSEQQQQQQQAEEGQLSPQDRFLRIQSAHLPRPSTTTAYATRGAAATGATLSGAVLLPLGAVATEVARAVAGTAEAAVGAEGAGEGGILGADSPLMAMEGEERAMFLQGTILGQVRALVGHAVGPDDPLMGAGVDSRAAMELRLSIATSTGLALPPTLLYDYPAVSGEAGGGRGRRQEFGGCRKFHQPPQSPP